MDRSSSLTPRPSLTLRKVLADFASSSLPDVPAWCVAVSGGADSLALAAAAAAIRPTTALIVDHDLQSGSQAVAETARRQALELGCVDARVLRVTVSGPGGPEAAARGARYSALDDARAGAPVLLAHTLDDQAETVLLGLGRGSGARSIAGMRVSNPPWFRPLLGIRRADTRASCTELGIDAWDDPHNHDRRFTRVRLRYEVLPLLDEALGGGVAEALARTAAALCEDNDTLDALALRLLEAACDGDDTVCVESLGSSPAALRRRAIRAWLLAGGAEGLTDKQIRGVDALVTAWRGQGGVAVGSALRRARLFAARRGGRLILYSEPV